MLYWGKYIYNVEFSFVKMCIHFFGGSCIHHNDYECTYTGHTFRVFLHLYTFRLFSLLSSHYITLRRTINCCWFASFELTPFFARFEFLQRCCWRSKSSEMWCCVVGQGASEFWKNSNVFFFRIKQSKKYDLQPQTLTCLSSPLKWQ